MVETEKYNLEKVRPRPPYTPRTIQCPSCGGGLSQKDEHSELIVCDYCGSHLDVSSEEKTVLGKGPAHKPKFPLEIGDPFHFKNSRFEIIARMRFLEEGDPNEQTLQYLLYNPRMGTMWLDAYQGNYSISRDTHVMPKDDAFDKSRGDTLETHDGRKWVSEGKGTYELKYVDGALPWIAKIGDRIRYAEFSEMSGSGEQYEVQIIADEIEYGTGRALTIDFVRKATRKPDLEKTVEEKAGNIRRPIQKEPPENVAQTRKYYLRLMAIAALVLLVNGALAAYTFMQDKRVLSQTFGAEELNEGIETDSFPVSKANSIIKITTKAWPKLSNEWMALDVVMVRDDDKMFHEYDGNIEYYHGSSGGEKWSEGGQTHNLYLRVPQKGYYRLIIGGVSARGNTPKSSRTTHGIQIRVKDRVVFPWFFVASTVLSLVFLILIGSSYKSWKDEDDD